MNPVPFYPARWEPARSLQTPAAVPQFLSLERSMRVSGRDAARRGVPALAETAAEPSLLQEISRGDQQAFAVLFDRTAGIVAADLTASLPDQRQRIAILAATYIEVWWLAGCHIGPEPDITQWIRAILDRRIGAVSGDETPHEPAHGRAERELAGLLSRPIEDLWPT
jgi:hypothetical protein